MEWETNIFQWRVPWISIQISSHGFDHTARTKVEPYPPPLPTMPPLPNQLTDQERSWTLKIGWLIRTLLLEFFCWWNETRCFNMRDFDITSPVSTKACRRLWMLQPGYLIVVCPFNRAHQRVVSFSAFQLKQVSLWGRNPPWNISTAIVSVRRTHLRIVFSIRKGQGKIEMRQIQGAYRKERHVAIVLNW